MNDEGIDPQNQIHLAALHYVYLKLINKSLNIWREAWNKHRIRTTKTSPLRLWISGQLQNPFGADIPSEYLELYGVERNVKDHCIEDERPTFVSPTDGILMNKLLSLYTQKFPWMIFQQILALMTKLQPCNRQETQYSPDIGYHYIK